MDFKEILSTAFAVAIGFVLYAIIVNTIGKKVPIISHYDDTYDDTLEGEMIEE